MPRQKTQPQVGKFTIQLWVLASSNQTNGRAKWCPTSKDAVFKMSACKIDMESRRGFLRRHTMKLLVAPIAIHAKRNDKDTNASQAKRPIASQLAPFPQHSEKSSPQTSGILYPKISSFCCTSVVGSKVLGVLLQAVTSPGSSGNPLRLVP